MTQRHLAIASYRLILVALCIAAGSCNSGKTNAMGDEGQSCYPNKTCNAGLNCIADICTRLSDAQIGDYKQVGDHKLTDSITGRDGGSDLSKVVPDVGPVSRNVGRDKCVRRGQTANV